MAMYTISNPSSRIIAQLNRVMLKSGKYEQYQIIAQAKRKVEKANLKGLYQALTLYTCVLDNFVSARKRMENPKQSRPKVYNVSFFSLSARIKFIAQSYRPVVLLKRESFENFPF